jgi:hypothetical protein
MMLQTTRNLGILGLASLLLLVGCFSVRVRTDWDPNAEFDTFQRYHWLEPPVRQDVSPFADNDLLRAALRTAIEKALGDRGFRSVESAEEADFLVTWDLTLEERLQASGVSTGGFYGRRRYWGGAYASSNIRTVQESTLLIDLLDAGSGLLVWRGWGSGIVTTRDRNRDQDRMNEGVRQILAHFPPGGSDS